MGQWQGLARIYWSLGSPLRPAATDVDSIRVAIDGCGADVLLLGVTPELSLLGEQVTAVDHSPLMIENVWPGDDERRRALLAPWVNLPFPAGRFSAAIGDGTLTSVGYDFDRALIEVRRVLAPDGVAAFRLYCRPERGETLAEIREDVEQGWKGNVHALKWRIGMAVAADAPDSVTPVQPILAAFNRLFPDRARLAARTGWTLEEIATFDAFQGARHATCFLTLSEVLDRGARLFGSARVVENHGYPLAERCPTIVWNL